MGYWGPGEDPASDEAQARVAAAMLHADALLHNGDAARLEQARSLLVRLREAEVVRVGMTREELSAEFSPAGGVSTPWHQRLRHRDCHRVLLRVEWEMFEPKFDADGQLIWKWELWYEPSGRRGSGDRRDTLARFAGPYLG